MSAPEKTMAELAAEYGLAANEYQVILDRLGREPNQVELGVFSVMWSEHCSYKSSKIHLGKFPTTGPRVICGPGENAGVIDIDDGDACIFKMESHNHPSFIEPYQGAAADLALASDTGVVLDATSEQHAHILLFAEDQARYLVAVQDAEELIAAARAAGLHASVVGQAGGTDFASKGLFSIPLKDLRAKHEGWMPGWIQG